MAETANWIASMVSSPKGGMQDYIQNDMSLWMKELSEVELDKP